MKDNAATIAVMAMMLSLTACRTNQEEQANVYASGQSELAEPFTSKDSLEEIFASAEFPVPEPDELPVVSIETVNDDRYDTDGNLLVSYARDQVTVSGTGYEKLAETVAGWEKDLYDSADELEKQVIESRGGVGGWNPPYEFVLRIKTVLLTDKLLSLNGSGHIYLGGAHDMPYQKGATFAVQTGRQLSLRELFADYSGFQSFAIPYVIHALEENEVLKGGLIEGYQAVIETNLFSDTRQWYLTEEGIVLYIEVYEVAPYAAGDIVVTIPYEEIASYLTDGYGLRPDGK